MEEIITKGKVVKNTDSISDLPVHILHHILSYLPCKESARTSVLSKQWSSIQKSFPILEFEVSPNDAFRFKKRIRELLDIVDRSVQHLVQNKLCIKRMRLVLPYIYHDSVPLVDTWLPLALHNGVSDLDFHVNVVGENYPHYPLPETTFAVNSSLLCGYSKFVCLEKLTLSNVWLSEDIVRSIIRNCPNIGHLYLDFCGSETLNISKLDKLVSFTIVRPWFSSEMKRVYVDALSLEQFFFSSFTKSPTCDIDLTPCYNLRAMKLFNNFITNSQFHHHISKFPLLEALDISLCHSVRRICFSLKRLKHLLIDRCGELKTIEIDAPVLSRLEIATCGDKLPVPTMISSKLSFNLNEPRDFINPPRFEVGCLDLEDLSVTSSSNLETLLDRLISSCHPRIVSMTSKPLYEDDYVKILYKMLVEREQQYCFYRLHGTCWCRRLKAVKIESINGIELNIANVREIITTNNKQLPHASDTSLSIPFYAKVRFRLDWDLSGINDLEFLDVFKFST